MTREGKGAGMLESQKLQMRLSEIRERLNTMSGDDETEFRAEDADALTTEYREAESRYRVALVKEADEIESTPTGDLDSEGRESRALELEIEVRHYVESALTDAPLEGREREFNDANKLFGVGTQLPWAALLSPEARAEMRAATVAPDVGGTHSRSILGRVFAKSAADYLGVVSPMVPTGSANFPVLSGGVVPANVEAAGAANETAAVLTANVLDPIRLPASYRMQYESIQKLAMMEDSLRLDLAGAIEEARDAAIIAGDGTAPAVEGFLSELTDPSNPSAVAVFADYASARAGLVDGKYAMSENDVKIVCGKETYKAASAIYQSGSGTSALEKFGARVSAHVTAPASNIQKAIASMSQGRAVAPMWPAIGLIRDVFSGAAKGEIILTATVLWNFAILDSSGFSLLEFKLA